MDSMRVGFGVNLMSTWAALRPRTALRRFRNESGAITVEAVLWVPFFVFFFVIIADVSLMFHGQSKAMRIVQDANRHASSGYFMTKDEVEANILAAVQVFAPNATVETTYGLLDVATTVVIPASDLQAVGLIAKFAGLNITITSNHLLEI